MHVCAKFNLGQCDLRNKANKIKRLKRKDKIKFYFTQCNNFPICVFKNIRNAHYFLIYCFEPKDMIMIIAEQCI